MITKFDTSQGGSAPGKSGKGSSVMLYLALAVGGFLLYKYVIKPKLDSKQDEDN